MEEGKYYRVTVEGFLRQVPDDETRATFEDHNEKTHYIDPDGAGVKIEEIEAPIKGLPPQPGDVWGTDEGEYLVWKAPTGADELIMMPAEIGEPFGWPNEEKSFKALNPRLVRRREP